MNNSRPVGRRSQAGMTAIGWVTVLAVLGIFVLAAMRLLPPYLQYFRIVSVLKGVEAEFDNQKTTSAEIKRYMGTRFDVEAITVITPSQVSVKRDGRGFIVSVNYDHRTPFIGPVNFIMTFEEEVEVQP